MAENGPSAVGQAKGQAGQAKGQPGQKKVPFNISSWLSAPNTGAQHTPTRRAVVHEATVGKTLHVLAHRLATRTVQLFSQSNDPAILKLLRSRPFLISCSVSGIFILLSLLLSPYQTHPTRETTHGTKTGTRGSPSLALPAPPPPTGTSLSNSFITSSWRWLSPATVHSKPTAKSKSFPLSLFWESKSDKLQSEPKSAHGAAQLAGARLPVGSALAAGMLRCQLSAPAAFVPALHWDPRPGQYLIMLCFRGQMSDLIKCMHNHILLSALLNRTLLIPQAIPFSHGHRFLPIEWRDHSSSHHRVFDMRIVWDLSLFQQCLGQGKVVRMVDFFKARNETIPLDAIQCWSGTQGFCRSSVEKEDASCPARLASEIGDTPGAAPKSSHTGLVPEPLYFSGRLPLLNTQSLDSTLVNASCLPWNASVEDVLAAYATPNSRASSSNFLMVGELSSVAISDPSGRLFALRNATSRRDAAAFQMDLLQRREGCPNRLLIHPSQPIMDRAKELIKRWFGEEPFGAVHWRSGHDSLSCASHAPGACPYTGPQSASCVAAVLKREGIRRVFVATKANEQELLLMERSLNWHMDFDVTFVSSKDTASRDSSTWQQSLQAQGIRPRTQAPLISNTLQKVICALSTVFVGSARSRYTEDIRRLRSGLGTESTCDENLCGSAPRWEADRLARSMDFLRSGPAEGFHTKDPQDPFNQLATWQAWELPAQQAALFPSKEAAALDPARFELQIKVLTFDRVSSTLRLLQSLERANYLGDRVSLEIFVDHPNGGAKWMSEGAESEATPGRKQSIAARNEMLRSLDSFRWSHGPKSIHARERNSGIQFQWVEAWWPENANQFALVAEDDVEVSPLFYVYLKRLLAFYYYNQSNFDASVFGVGLQRQKQVLGKCGFDFKNPGEVFQYQFVGSWGQVLFPAPWRDFRTWYEENRFETMRPPVLNGTIAASWFRKTKGYNNWTPWHVQWVYVRHTFNLYTGFPNKWALSVSHREKGENTNALLGADATLLMPNDLSSQQPAGQMKVEERLGGMLQDPPDWWTALPSSMSIQKFDLCFRRLPNVRTPFHDFESLWSALPHFGTANAIAIVAAPTSESTYKLIRNWLCFVDGLDRHNHSYVILFQLHPTDGACAELSATLNHKTEKMAADLARRGHLVFVAPPMGSKAAPDSCPKHMVKAKMTSIFSLSQAHVAQQLLDKGKDVFIQGLYGVWRRDPIQCIEESSSKTEDWVFWAFVPPRAGWTIRSLSSFAIWAKSSEGGRAKYSKFLEVWQSSGLDDLGHMPARVISTMEKVLGKVQRAQLDQYYFRGGKHPAAACVSIYNKEVLPFISRPWVGEKSLGVNLVSPSVNQLKENSLWLIDDNLNSCATVSCRRIPQRLCEPDHIA